MPKNLIRRNTWISVLISYIGVVVPMYLDTHGYPSNPVAIVLIVATSLGLVSALKLGLKCDADLPRALGIIAAIVCGYWILMIMYASIQIHKEYS